VSNPRDYRDTVVMLIVIAGWVAATVFLFWQPSAVNFATWAGLVATIGGIFHWLCISDDKRIDAGNVAAVLPNMAEGTASENRDWREHVGH
jgi:hypothetical protein